MSENTLLIECDSAEQFLERIAAPICELDSSDATLDTVVDPSISVESNNNETLILDSDTDDIRNKLSQVAFRELVFTEGNRLPDYDNVTLESVAKTAETIFYRVVESAKELGVADMEIHELIEIAGQGLCYYLTGETPGFKVMSPDRNKVEYEGVDLIPEGWTTLLAKELIDEVENSSTLTNEQQKKLISLMKSYSEMLLVGSHVKSRLDIEDRVTIDRFTRIAKRAENLFMQRNLSLVRSQAGSIKVKDPELLQEIMQEGLVGLFDAADVYDNELYDVTFEKFAAFRIRGAMIDYLRQSGRSVRLTRSLIRDIQILNDLEVIGANEAAIREELGMDKDQLVQLRKAAALSLIDSLDETAPGGGSVSENLGVAPDAEDAGETIDKFEEDADSNRKLIMGLVSKARFSRKEKIMFLGKEGIDPDLMDEDGIWLTQQLNSSEDPVISLGDIAEHYNFTESRACQLMTFLRLRMSMAISVSLIAKATFLSEEQEGYLLSFFTPKNKWGDIIEKPSPTQLGDSLKQVHQYLGKEIESAINAVVDSMSDDECTDEDFDTTYLTLCYDLGITPVRLSQSQIARIKKPKNFTNRKYYKRLVTVLEAVAGIPAKSE